MALLNKCHIHVTLKGSEFDKECELEYAIKFLITIFLSKVNLLYRHSEVVECCLSLLFLVCGNKESARMQDMELRILQPTMSSTKMVDGAFLTGLCIVYFFPAR